MSRTILFVAGAASAVTITAGTVAIGGGPETQKSPSRQVLVGTDLGKIRRDAMASHPVGSRIVDVAMDMENGGFRCVYRPHLMENITAPSVVCDSNGRAAESSPHIALVLISRSGALTDIAVSNGLDQVQASAMTPDPDPGGITSAPETIAVQPDPEWDAIVSRALARYPKAGWRQE